MVFFIFVTKPCINFSFTSKLWCLCFHCQVLGNLTVSIFFFWLKLIQIWAQFSNSHRNDIELINIYVWICFSWWFVVYTCTFLIWMWRMVSFNAKIAIAPRSAIFFRQWSKIFCSWAPATTSWFKTFTGSIRLWQNSASGISFDYITQLLSNRWSP